MREDAPGEHGARAVLFHVVDEDKAPARASMLVQTPSVPTPDVVPNSTRDAHLALENDAELRSGCTQSVGWRRFGVGGEEDGGRIR